MSSSRPGLLQRFTRTQTEVDADRLEGRARHPGAAHVRDCIGGTTTTVTGPLRSAMLRPVVTAPVVEAELGDGTGRRTLLVLGRRRIPGITPGRVVVVHRPPIVRDGEAALVHPRDQLLPCGTD